MLKLITLLCLTLTFTHAKAEDMRKISTCSGQVLMGESQGQKIEIHIFLEKRFQEIGPKEIKFASYLVMDTDLIQATGQGMNDGSFEVNVTDKSPENGEETILYKIRYDKFEFDQNSPATITHYELDRNGNIQEMKSTITCKNLPRFREQ